MKAIKSGSFSRALADAGLTGKQFAWSHNGALSLGENLTDDERQQILDVYKAYQAPDDEPEGPMMPMPLPPQG